MPDHDFRTSASTLTPRVLVDSDIGLSAGLSTRTLMGPIVDRQLAACRKSGASMAVMSISLDDFGSVAQKYGQTVRAHLVQAAWNRLRTRLRATDHVVRVGCGEFGAVLLGAAASVAEMVDARVTDSLGRPYAIGALEVAVAVRIGVAIYSEDLSTADALVVAAEQARLDKLGCQNASV